MKKRKQKTLDSEFFGPEPTKVVTVSDQINAMNWYNYFYDAKSARKWLVEYCQKNKLSLTNVREVNMTMCSLARMLNRGMDLPESSRKYLHRKLADKVKKVDVAPKPPPKPYNFAWIEAILDEFYMNGYKVFEPKIYDELLRSRTKVGDTAQALSYYTDILQDVKENKRDYMHSGAKAYRAHVQFLTKIIDEIEIYSRNTRKKSLPKKRRIKTQNASKVVQQVKFQLRDDKLRVVSEPPEKLVGAYEVFVFNTKYRHLIHYVGDGPMSVRGTTLQNFNPEKSGRKTLRKPMEFFDLTRGATLPAIRKAWGDVKSKPGSVNGRLNEHCIILKVK